VRARISAHIAATMMDQLASLFDEEERAARPTRRAAGGAR
jgi:hypothetical protein